MCRHVIDAFLYLKRAIVNESRIPVLARILRIRRRRSACEGWSNFTSRSKKILTPVGSRHRESSNSDLTERPRQNTLLR
jgi:hypothetical protein